MIAAALLGEQATGAEAANILSGRWELVAPSHWKAEYANVLWKSVMLGRLDPQGVEELMGLAESIPVTSIEVMEIWRGAVSRSIAARHPVYDTLFVELAARLGTRVTSYDRKLKAKFPTLVMLPAELLQTD